MLLCHLNGWRWRIGLLNISSYHPDTFLLSKIIFESVFKTNELWKGQTKVMNMLTFKIGCNIDNSLLKVSSGHLFFSHL